MHFDLAFTPFQLILLIVWASAAGFVYWAVTRKHYKSAVAAMSVTIIISFFSPLRLTAPTHDVNIHRVQQIEQQRARDPLPDRVVVDILDRSKQREILDRRTQELRDRQSAQEEE